MPSPDATARTQLASRAVAQLRIKSTKKLPGGVIWTRYTVKAPKAPAKK